MDVLSPYHDKALKSSLLRCAFTMERTRNFYFDILLEEVAKNISSR